MMIGGTDEVGKALFSSYGVKVHHLMCKELINIVDRITQILPVIESSQPRCTSGVDALCSLNSALDRASSIIQHCTESSKLYLVITGDAIRLRCERAQSVLGQSLTQIQSMVPLLLAAQVSAIIDDLKDAKFTVDSSDEEAGKVLHHLLRHASDSTEDTASEAFQFAVSRLQLTSSKALLIEKRSIRKLLDRISGKDEAKERILKYLLNLVRKYGHPNGGPQSLNSTTMDQDLYPISLGDNVQLSQDEVQNKASSKLTPPDEFKCPISLRLMHDPVIIASGKTFERVWIEEWFKEGNNTCPKTQRKLSHLSVVPNSAMKDLISKWCKKHGLSIPDPSTQPIPKEVYHWKTSSCSIASFGSSLYNVPIRHDDSNVSFRSDLSSITPDMNTDSYISGQSSSEISHGTDYRYPSKLGELSWESQCREMEDVRNYLNEDTCDSILNTNFIQTLVTFFKDACDRSDVKAQRLGASVLRIFVTKTRNEVPSFYEDVFYLLISFLDSEIIEEALEIFEILSKEECCKLEIVASNALPPILKIIESEKTEFRILAMRILHNLSSQSNIGIQIIRLGYIPNLISLVGNKSFALHCISILRNLCATKEGINTFSESETNLLIPPIVELLETGSHEEQENAVGFLLSLCSHHVEYCQIVSDAGVIPSLAIISINGNANGKEIAKELLYILRDKCNENQSSESQTESAPELPLEPPSYPVERKSVSKTRGYFRRKINFFSKPKSVVLY